MAQINPEPNYDHRLAEWATLYLQTRDSSLFPFTEHFDSEQQRAFMNDLRIGLADLQDSGSARKTAAVGHIIDDTLLYELVREWHQADGGWPASADPENPYGLTSLVSTFRD